MAVTHYHGPVLQLDLEALLGDTSDAADGTQEVFSQSFRGIRCFRQACSPDKPWLYLIVWAKSRITVSDDKKMSLQSDAESRRRHNAIEIEDLGATPLISSAAHEVQQAVQHALQEIPQVFARCNPRDLEGLSYEEIAKCWNAASYG